MKFYIGITDESWFRTLRDECQPCEEVNFWKPGSSAFKALNPGELFLFKRHGSSNAIVGGGTFLKYFALPVSLAWEAFGITNGTRSYSELVSRLRKYNPAAFQTTNDPEIGCVILSQPFFLHEHQYINGPEDWKKPIVQGKVYSTDSLIGKRLYDDVLLRRSGNADLLICDASADRYGKPVLVQPRLGQGSFKAAITETYHRRCAITGERTLPVLEAVHIKPYHLDGPHDVRNGILLRSDLHTLFDRGYLAISNDYRLQVSDRIKKDYGNGREYYAHQGRNLLILPDDQSMRPSEQFIGWHRENVFLDRT